MAIPPNATGSHDRVRLKRPFPNSITVHGTVITFDPPTGNFTALMDYQEPNATPIAFTRQEAGPGYIDGTGLPWLLAA